VTTDSRTILKEALTDAVLRTTSHDAGVRADDGDPEHVHQSRVGIRRFRTILKEFRVLFDDGWSQTLRKEAKSLADALGEVRDADVMLSRLGEEMNTFLREDQSEASVIVDRLRTERKTARDRLLVAMRDPGHEQLLEDLFSAARRPRFSDEIDNSTRSLLDFAAGAFGRVKREVNAMSADPSASGLHRVRILIKRARYTAEAVAPLASKEAIRYATKASAVQDVLGELQDATVAAQWLREFAGSTPSVVFTAGRFAQIQLSQAAEARRRWHKVWDRLDRKRVTAWLYR
jgi:CHAD domain-containing protein